MANAILMAGMCSSQFAGPPFIRLLQRQLGFKGATFIVSAVLLNCCVGAMFFHPVKWHLKPLPKANGLPVPPPILKDALEKLKNSEETEALMNGKEQKASLTPPAVLKTRRAKQLSNSSNVSSVAISMVDLSGVSHQRGCDSDIQGGETKPKKVSLVVRVIRSLISDLGILRYHRAKIIAFGGLFLVNGYINFMMTFPFAVQAAGHTLEDSAWCISITGVCNFIARLSASVLSDYLWFNMKIMYVVGAVIIATCAGSKFPEILFSF